jgi:hypothetical protein
VSYRGPIVLELIIICCFCAKSNYLSSLGHPIFYKFQENRLLGRPRRRRGHNIKMFNKEIGCKLVVALYGPVVGYCGNSGLCLDSVRLR